MDALLIEEVTATVGESASSAAGHIREAVDTGVTALAVASSTEEADTKSAESAPEEVETVVAASTWAGRPPIVVLKAVALLRESVGEGGARLRAISFLEP